MVKLLVNFFLKKQNLYLLVYKIPFGSSKHPKKGYDKADVKMKFINSNLRKKLTSFLGKKR